MHNKFYEKIKEYTKNQEGNEKQMWETIKIIGDFLEDLPHEYHDHIENMMEEIKEVMCPFLNEEQAKYYTSKIVNCDGTQGPHFTMEQVLNTLNTKHIDKETELYSFYDIYVQINLIYSDLGPVLGYDNDKIISASLAYLNDRDFPGKGEISYTKWYCEAKEELEEEHEEE